MRYLLMILSLFMVSYCYALKSDESKPVQIDADHATVDQKNMVSVFSGNVVISKGTFVVHADKGEAKQNKIGERVLDLYGEPVTFMQTADDGQKILGQCNHINYNTRTSLAVLSGRARVSKGHSVVIGDSLTYNTKTQVYSAISSFGNGVNHQNRGRVTVILDQKEQEQNEKK